MRFGNDGLIVLSELGALVHLEQELGEVLDLLPKSATHNGIAMSIRLQPLGELALDGLYAHAVEGTQITVHVVADESCNAEGSPAQSLTNTLPGRGTVAYYGVPKHRIRAPDLERPAELCLVEMAQGIFQTFVCAHGVFDRNR